MKRLTLLLFVFLFIVLACDKNVLAYNRLDTGQNRQKFYNSPSKVEADPRFARQFEILVLDDHRDKFIGETVYQNVKIEKYNDFWDKPLGELIVTKIKGDLQTLAGSTTDIPRIEEDKIVIKPTLEVFYPSVTGFFWVRCQTKVRLHFLVTAHGKVILNKIYEKTYITSGTDKGFEGSIVNTINKFANIAIGMCLRMALDDFYLELKSSM